MVQLFNRLFLLFSLQSSLAAARADNFYYPPEWSPKKVWVSSLVNQCVDSSFGSNLLIHAAVPVVFAWSGWIEQVSWPACAQGAGEKAWSGHPDYKVCFLRDITLFSCLYIHEDLKLDYAHRSWHLSTYTHLFAFNNRLADWTYSYAFVPCI